MEKLWTGRLSGRQNQQADDFNSSLRFDRRLLEQDIRGSLAHAAMLTGQGILSGEDGEAIAGGLAGILEDIRSGTLQVDPRAEDVHTFVEMELTRRIGDAGRRLHTARSRNDQVAVDLRLYLREEAGEICAGLGKLLEAILFQAETNRSVIMPGYTHLQRAQPVTFSQHMLAYAMMFTRDVDRIKDAVRRMNRSPLGSCALAGTTYPIDREATAAALGFDGITQNSMDGVSDRDFCVELLSALSLVMMHLSRLSQEIILWDSWEFRFVKLEESFTTGSSIMPQKKNPDIAELVRGKTGRVYGDLMGMLTVLKGLPLAYNKDLQEDKEAVFDGVDTVKACLDVFAPMIRTMEVLPENMYRAAQKGFLNATDLADYLTKKGTPFRSAYQIAGRLVAHCISRGCVLEELPLEELKSFSGDFGEDVYDEISLQNCVKRRTSAGGTGPESVDAQIRWVKEFLEEQNDN